MKKGKIFIYLKIFFLYNKGMKQEQNFSNGAFGTEPNNAGPEMISRSKKTMAGMAFSGVILAMLFVSLLFSFTLAMAARQSGQSIDALTETEWYKYCSYLLYQVVFAVFIVVYKKIDKTSFRALGYRKTHPKYFLLAFLLAFGLLFSLNWVNTLFLEALSKIGYQMPDSSVPSVEGARFLLVLLVIAVLPALCEETIFRGILLEGIKDCGTVAACLVCGALFSIFHQNPAQTIYQFLCGCVFALLVLRADSILPAVVLHFLNNAVVVFDLKFSFLEKIGTAGSVVIYVVSALCLIGAMAYMLFIDKKLNRKKEGKLKPFVLASLIGVALCVILWIVNLFSGIVG